MTVVFLFLPYFIMNHSLTHQSDFDVGGKAANLQRLQNISSINIPPFIVVNTRMDDQVLRENLQQANLQTDLSYAVRSSALAEDSQIASFAGAYESVLDVPGNSSAIINAVREIQEHAESKKSVLDAYSAERGIEADTSSELGIVVQEMVPTPDFSGVIFSHEHSKKDGYYNLQYHQGIGVGIVDGSSNGKHVRINRNVGSIENPFYRELISAMRTIENEYGSSSLDVEFAYKNNQLYILQCRPLTVHGSPDDFDNLVLDARMVEEANEQRIQSQVLIFRRELDRLMRGTVLGDMVDINPRELLGPNPLPINVSIFNKIFAENIVENARGRLGYKGRSSDSSGLLRVVGSKPYVDVRASALSIQPKGLNDEIYEKFVQHYIQQLTQHPELQDRVEFDVFLTSDGLDLDNFLESESVKLSAAEKKHVKLSFQALDKDINNGLQQQILGAQDFEQYLGEYNAKIVRQKTKNQGFHQLNEQDYLETLQDGTGHFTMIARGAFYLRSKYEQKHGAEKLNLLLQQLGKIPSCPQGQETIYSKHLVNLEGTALGFEQDLHQFHSKQLSLEEMNERYGHLRPGQFNIYSEAYRDNPTRYYPQPTQESNHVSYNVSELTEEEQMLLFFLQAREKMKFTFMKAFDSLAHYLRDEEDQVFIDPESLKYISIDEYNAVDIPRLNAADLEQRKYKYRLHNFIPLPDVIHAENSSLDIIEYPTSKPSYVTEAQVQAEPVYLSAQNKEVDAAGKIVFLESADPGYDYLLHKGIAGLVTRVGGPASHMYIRTAELGIPACIGAGETLYNSAQGKTVITLDALNKQIIA